MSDAEPRMALRVVQDIRLTQDERRADALVVISLVAPAGTAGPRAGTPPERRGEVIVLDRSTSMEVSPEKIEAARAAGRAAIGALEDGVRFAVVVGNHDAVQIYPEEGLAGACDRTRAEAKQAVRTAPCFGGTTIGAWLMCAKSLFDKARPDLRHVLLLTDGRNEHDERSPLEPAKEACADAFVCDTLGIGDDYEIAELLDIARVLHGEADALTQESNLAALFRRRVSESQRREIGDVVLEVEEMSYCEVTALQQTFPRIVDLTDRARRSESGVTALSTGAWAPGERKEFQLTLRLAEDADLPTGVDRLLAQVRVRAPQGVRLPDEEEVVGRRVSGLAGSSRGWSGTPQDRQQVLRDSVWDGWTAYKAGEQDQAGEHWGRAVVIAHETRNRGMLAALGEFLEIVDAASGEVRLRPGITRRQIYAAITASHQSQVQADDGDDRPAVAEQDTDQDTEQGSGDSVPCPNCTRPVPVSRDACECGWIRP